MQEYGYAYLKQQKKLQRPISPHLTIYQPQLTWLLSGAHRFAGCLMGGSEFALLFRCSSSGSSSPPCPLASMRTTHTPLQRC